MGLQGRVGEREAVGAEDEAEDLLGHDEEPDRSHEGHQRRLVQQGLVGETIDAHAGGADHGHRHHQRQCDAAGVVGHDDPGVAAHREQRRVHHVQDAQQPVDQGQPEGDQGVDRPLHQPLDGQVEEQHRSAVAVTGSRARRSRMRRSQVRWPRPGSGIGARLPLPGPHPVRRPPGHHPGQRMAAEYQDPWQQESGQWRRATITRASRGGRQEPGRGRITPPAAPEAPDRR